MTNKPQVIMGAVWKKWPHTEQLFMKNHYQHLTQRYILFLMSYHLMSFIEAEMWSALPTFILSMPRTMPGTPRMDEQT